MPTTNRLDPPRVLGILGGVGSGKSSLSGLLAEEGFVILDADREAAQILDSAGMQPILEELFGPQVLGPDGPRREKIASAIFADPPLRKRLEEAMHPRIRKTMLAELDAALAQGRSVVLDVPLLLEGGLIELCDRILFLEVPDPIREARVRARGMSAEDWRRREAAQAPLSVKRSHADQIFDNSGSIEDLRAQVRDWLRDECGPSSE